MDVNQYLKEHMAKMKSITGTASPTSASSKDAEMRKRFKDAFGMDLNNVSDIFGGLKK